MEKIYHRTNPTYLSPEELKHYLKTMSILDIIMNSEEDSWLRVVQKYSSEKTAYYISNGGGDEMDIFFEENGVFIRGFDHENELNQFGANEWDDAFFEKTYEDVPHNFLDIYEDEEFVQTMTFCLWYDYQTCRWNQNAVEGNDGGMDYLLGYITKNATEWTEWANDHYETDIDESIIEKAYNDQPLTAEDIHILNPERDAQAALREIAHSFYMR